ncbi:MAG: 30S ribosomal protein S6 [Solirubrobacterales bacterium]
MNRTYELILMLDPEQAEEDRNELAGKAAGILQGGEIVHETTWGLRKMAFEIDHRREADYRFWRFSAGNDVLEQLDHQLKITDGVLRFRVFEVDPRTPVIVPEKTSTGPPAAEPAPS